MNDSGRTYSERGKPGDLTEELKRRILVLDGAMGTQVQSLGLSEADFRGERYRGHPRDLLGNNDILCLTRPQAVGEIHRSYLDAGADIVTTNTFNATPIGQAEYGTEMDVYDINFAGARLAREAAEEFTARDPSRPRFVAGSLGPTGKSCSIASDVDDPARRDASFDEIADAYRMQAEGLVDGGVDVLLVETVFDTLNAKAALFAIARVLDERGVDLPVWVSATISDAGGRLLAGQTPEAFWISISHAAPLCVGLNCGLGAEALRPHIMALSAVADVFVSIHPNAGLPDDLGEYVESPQAMARSIQDLAGSGLVNIAGGCCGTTPAHVAAMAEAVSGVAPRRIPAVPRHSRFSGLDAMEIRPGSLFVNVGERTNMTGSARFARLIKEGRREEAMRVARDQIRDGAQMIDVNMDDPLLDSAGEMAAFLNLIASDPEIARVPVMIDSARWEVIESGLKCIQGKGVVNSISLKDGEEEFVRRARLVRRYGAGAVVMAFDEKGQAQTCERKVEVCTRAYRILTERVNFPPQDIILDPAIFAVGTGLTGRDDSAVSFIEACRTLKGTLPHCLVSGGVSNLSFAFRGADAIREAMHSVFLYHAIRAGMDMGIVNAGRLGVYEEIPEEVRSPVEDLILDRSPDALAVVMDIARRTAGGDRNAHAPMEPDWRKRPVGERIEHALVNGISDFIEEDALEAMKALGATLSVIEGPLMSGMGRVGDLFGSGKMFLPQVIRSARVMKKAVAALEPHMESPGGAEPEDGAAELGRATGRSRAAKAKVMLATVRGDVHDIGKNIVGVVLGCNNCDVTDLGTGVTAEEIVGAARRERPDFIGLSGLITPSLEEMCRVASELRRAGVNTPLLIGGATTSPAHTAARIDPAYEGAVLHVRDASRAMAAVNSLAGAGAESVEAVKAGHARVRDKMSRREGGLGLLPIREARRRRPPVDWTDFVPVRPRRLGVTVFESYPIEDLLRFIDWTPLFRVWKLRGAYPEVLEDERFGKEARALLSDAEALLKRIVDEELLSAGGVVGIFAANSLGDDIELYADEDRSKPRGVLHCLRRQREDPRGPGNLCLADYIAPKTSGVADYMGAFVASAGFGCDDLARRFEGERDDYSAILAKALADRLAEALAERLHLEVRRELWGYETEGDAGEGGAGRRPVGIRPAPGYPSCPDHSSKDLLFDILGAKDRIGVSLTENFAIRPAASVAGWYFAHPEARYFKVGPVGEDQLADYARRKGVSVADVKRWLAEPAGRRAAGEGPGHPGGVG